MLKPSWTHIWGHARRRRKRRSTAALRRPVRLHAEKLEDRYLMSVNRAAGAVEQGISASNLPSATAARQVVAATGRTDTDSISAALAAETTWERFGSKKELRAWLIQAAAAEWSHLFGQPTYYYNHFYMFEDSIRIADVQLMGSMGLNDLDASFSATNLQVEGVDEADLVETDGSFLYIVSGQDLVVVSVGDGDDFKVMSRIHFDERPIGMYLAGDRLAIVSSSPGDYWSPVVRPIAMIDTIDIGFPIGMFQSTGSSQSAERSGPMTTVTVLDVADRAAPTFVQKTELDGQLISSRTVDGELRLVVNNDLRLPPPIAKLVEGPTQELTYPPLDMSGIARTSLFMTADMWWPNSYSSNYVYETQEEYVDRVYDEILDTFEARFRSLAADGSVISDSPLYKATDLYRPDGLRPRNITTVATFDLNSNHAGPVDRASVMTGEGAQVYATTDSVYVFSQKVPAANEGGDAFWNAPPKTSVWKFGMDGDSHSVELSAKGEFDGTLLNQFAADEHNGYLRVVSQAQPWTNIGQSLVVRFVGDRAFFVTFRQVDPLFVVDLSDPTDPRLAGELHIPGFSEYLQPIDETHLLAIGRDVDLSSGRFLDVGDLQVSIFDVSDLSNPQLTQRSSFGGGSSTVTPATGGSFTRGDGDHHAVSYFADEQILALPVNTLPQYDWRWGAQQTASLFEPGQGGLQVFKVDVDSGFTPIGLVEHDTLIQRSLRIGDRLFAISSGTVSVHNLLDPNVELGEVDIAASAEMQSLALTPYQAKREEPNEQLFMARSSSPEVVSITAIPAAQTDEVNGGAAAMSLPQAGWVLRSVTSSRHTQPARVAAFEGTFHFSHRFDNALVRLLASDAPREESVFDFLNHDDDQSAQTRMSSATSESIGLTGSSNRRQLSPW
jgi:uncharacterized secreted protein with C-terminal beta-propeller domain